MEQNTNIGACLELKISKNVKDSIYHNAYIEVCATNGKGLEDIMSKEELFKDELEEKEWGNINTWSEEDGSQKLTVVVKEGFILDTIVQLVFMYTKFKTCIDSLIPSTKAFLLKWFPKRYENYENE